MSLLTTENTGLYFMHTYLIYIFGTCPIKCCKLNLTKKWIYGFLVVKSQLFIDKLFFSNYLAHLRHIVVYIYKIENVVKSPYGKVDVEFIYTLTSSFIATNIQLFLFLFYLNKIN